MLDTRRGILHRRFAALPPRTHSFQNSALPLPWGEGGVRGSRQTCSVFPEQLGNPNLAELLANLVSGLVTDLFQPLVQTVGEVGESRLSANGPVNRFQHL